MSLHYLPPVKPSAIALGTFFNHGIELAVLGPVFGQTYQRAKQANTKEEFIKSKEASGAAIAWGTSFVGSALQSYGVGALINATGTLSYKGAAYLGGLIFAATAAPGVSFFLFSGDADFFPPLLSLSLLCRFSPPTCYTRNGVDGRSWR
ncbi:hypothetical protein J3459_005946 [Metarhizium acridum]|nr:hypothetical protein J3459_005946 [Metarhizium acridum]